jgi:hypothetical protein
MLIKGWLKAWQGAFSAGCTEAGADPDGAGGNRPDVS